MSISHYLIVFTIANVSIILFQCLIGSKVQGIETALTFIHDNAHVTLPIISSSALLLSSDRTKELTSDLTSPNGTLSTTSVVTRIVDRYAETLRKQRLGFILCILIWVLVFFMGIFGVWWRLDGEGRYAEWRGRRETFGNNVGEKDKYDLRAFQLQQPTTDTDDNKSHTLPDQSTTELNHHQPTSEFNDSNSRFDLNNFRKDLKLRNPLAGKDLKSSVTKAMRGVREVSTRLKNSRSDKKDAMGNGWDKMDSQEELEASPRKRRNVEPTSSASWDTTAYSSYNRLSPIRSSFPSSFSPIPIFPNRNLPYSENQLPTSSSLASSSTSSTIVTTTSLPQHPFQTPLSPPPIPNLSQKNPFSSQLDAALSTPDPVLRKGNVREVGGRSTNPFDVPFVENKDMNPFSTPFDGVGEE